MIGLEIAVLIFVAGNFFLQSFWWRWSYKIHHRKHFTDSDANGAEIDFITNLEEYLDLKIKNEMTIKKRDEEWSEFISQTPKTPITDWRNPDDHAEPLDGLNSQNSHLEKDSEGKFNHEDIAGALDGMFASPPTLKEEK